MDVKLCSLQHAVGRVETCPAARCPFWEGGGAVLEGGCMFERLLPPSEWTPALAARWLLLRRSIEQARGGREVNEARSLAYSLIDQRRFRP